MRANIEDIESETMYVSFPELKRSIDIICSVEETEEFSEEEFDEVDMDNDIKELGDDLALDPDDERTLSFFMNRNQENRNFRDIILQKIEEKERVMTTGKDDVSRSTLNPKIIQAYTLIGKILKNYTSGKLPKPFNIIPSFQNWEEILYITKPEEWSPQAVLAATRIFISNLNTHLVQRFNYLFLYPRVREEIHRRKKLSYHLYQALKKALFKADAFYKGFLLPLCEAGDCTLKEAVIIGSLIKKISIPQIHSSVVLLKIAEMDYTGANSIFISILLNKKYALPYEVIDGLVDHFLRMKNETRKLPVLWHQSLLFFVQRYKAEITAEQKQQLKYLLRHQSHHLITPEIRNELFSTEPRKVEKMDVN